MAVPLYESQVRAPQVPGVELGTMQPVVGSSGEGIGAATSKLGEVLLHIGVKMKEARDQTEIAAATTDYLIKTHDAEREGVNSRDFRNAPQEFRNSQEALIAEATGSVSDPAKRAQLAARLTAHGLSSLGRVERAAHAREQNANLAALNTSEIDAQRRYNEANSDIEREAARRAHIGAIAGQVAGGWMSAQQGQQRTQAFNTNLDRSQYIADERVDPQGTRARLNDPKYLPNITDPRERELLKNQASNAADQLVIDRASVVAVNDEPTAREMVDRIEQPHNRYRAQHAIDTVVAQQEAERVRQVRAAAETARSMNDNIDIMKRGFMVDPVQAEQTLAANRLAAQAGDKAAAKYVHDYEFQSRLQPIVRQAYGMPIRELQTQIQNMEASMRAPGAKTTPEQVMALDAFKAVHANILAKRESSPIELGTLFGSNVYQLNALPIDNVKDQAFTGELSRRQPLIAGQQARIGGTANVLQEDEKTALKARWDEGSPQERFNIAAAISGSLTGRAYDDTMAAITAGDTVANVAGREAQRRPDLARELLVGQTLMHTPGLPKNKPEMLTTVLREKLGSQVFHDINEQTAAIEAAKALYVARMGAGQALYETPDERVLAKALEDVTGPITSINGRKVPTGTIRREVFEKSWRSLNDATLTILGGAVNNNGAPVSAEEVRTYGVLKPMSLGGTAYAVGVRDDTAPDRFAPYHRSEAAGGGALVIDMRNLVRARDPREPLARDELTTRTLRRPKGTLQDTETIDY